VEQPRIALGTQVENKLNLENLSITYQISDRYSVTADLPVMSASRHTNNSPIFYTTHGIGDVAFMAKTDGSGIPKRILRAIFSWASAY
jgi:hypothetical protein